MNKCPGADRLRDAKIYTKTCPNCGREIELFSILPTATCECGFVAMSDTQSCIKWCRYARDCVGAEIYDKYMREQERARELQQAGEA
ncbi:MAG: hypothetical protein LBC78_04630 [Oscillospiraceae bacterium]|jgi:hypothetical protein|nr:hypothetical protein [Oscillospiraceae bacterium]